MKAIVWTKYGHPDVLQLQEVEKPIPKDNEILIKIHATTVTAGDCEMRTLKFPLFLKILIRLVVGLRKPKRVTILGQELAGEIEAVGKDVTRFVVGDQVFGPTNEFDFGAYAEYICLPENTTLAKKPTNMSFEEAAAVPVGGLNALHFMRQVDIKPGKKILINGAGGSIGTIAIQYAKHFGAEVTVVDSTKKLTTLYLIGANRAIDYTQEDFSKSGETYDVIFDIVGLALNSGTMKLLNDNGVYLLGNPTLLRNIRGRWISWRSGKKIITGTADYKTEDLVYLRDLIEVGVMKTIIDRTYSLEQIAAAHKYVESGQKIGNVVIIVNDT